MFLLFFWPFRNFCSHFILKVFPALPPIFIHLSHFCLPVLLEVIQPPSFECFVSGSLGLELHWYWSSFTISVKLSYLFSLSFIWLIISLNLSSFSCLFILLNLLLSNITKHDYIFLFIIYNTTLPSAKSSHSHIDYPFLLLI